MRGLPCSNVAKGKHIWQMPQIGYCPRHVMDHSNGTYMKGRLLSVCILEHTFKRIAI